MKEAISTQEQVTKVGTASCRSILSLVATGDCSLEAAKKDGNIDHVNHVDWEADNILGIIGNYQVTVSRQSLAPWLAKCPLRSRAPR